MKAEALGEEDIANLLRENLEQEEHTLKEVDEKARKLTQATVVIGVQCGSRHNLATCGVVIGFSSFETYIRG